eukprot:CAMPEP_0177209136 /NCGR_PEP_ID=MMETSP0367-20130122/30860_1 /TAXON_ID=447022 ORGANISM="Scrippsiella hangoei-like, Strain SHHI-4" /NCGR_SAMPLE_ID=MMETSP0367 /ASSEMBLY_ACC=CAM_ASM_000362 /LENGTH=158 /DNA_ID=CAMNT_0018658159 /DNA_START=110 /DNA_END=587 /DNA_ORIENTATION=-
MADKGMMMRSMRLTADSSGFFNSSSSRASPSHSAMATSPDQRRRRETHLEAATSSWAGSSAGFGGAATGIAAAGRSRSQPSLVATTNTLGNHYMMKQSSVAKMMVQLVVATLLRTARGGLRTSELQLAVLGCLSVEPASGLERCCVRHVARVRQDAGH